MRQAWVFAYHSPRPSAREEALLEELSLLLPAAAEANEEASVDGMLCRSVGSRESYSGSFVRCAFECEMVCCLVGGLPGRLSVLQAELVR